MKFNKVLFAMLAGSGIFLASCLNEKPVVVEVPEPEPEPVETFVSGKILSRKADLCLLGRDSQMHPVLKLYAGDNVSVLEIDGSVDTKFIPDPGEADTQSAENEKTNVSLEKVDSSAGNADENVEKLPSGREYFHIVHDNLDFWLEKSVFALNCESAVAIEKTYMYSDSALTQKLDGTPNPLKFSALIAIALQESAEPSASVKVFYYDTEQKSVREAWVSAASVSSRKDDIVVSRIAEELKVTKRAVPRNELFARAAKYKPCAKVLAVLNAQKEEKKTYSYQEVLKSVQRMSFGVNVDELLTVDQSKDPFK